MEDEKPKPRPKPRTKPVINNFEQDNVTDTDENSKDKELNVSNPSLIKDLIEENKNLDTKITRLEEEEKSKRKKLQEINNQLMELKIKFKKLDKENEELDKKNESTNESSEEIQQLITVYEKMKQDEKNFKESCNTEMEKLQELLANEDEPDIPQNELETQLERAKQRVQAGKLEINSINRKVATLKRQIDQVPTRTELREYRIRFSELYNQVSATHSATKQFYINYNSLEDTKGYLEKELSLLNSIVDQYQEIQSVPSGREAYFRQLAALYDGKLKGTCIKVEKLYDSEKKAVEKLEREFQEIVDQKAAYEKCLKDLDAECISNDKLLTIVKKNDLLKNNNNNNNSS